MPGEWKTVVKFPGFAADNQSKAAEQYRAIGVEPSQTPYGWIRKA